MNSDRPYQTSISGSYPLGYTLRYLTKVVCRGKWILGLTILGVMGLVGGYLEWVQPVYEARATVVIDDAAHAASTLSGGGTQVGVEVEVLRSREIAARVVRQLMYLKSHDDPKLESLPEILVASFPIFNNYEGQVPDSTRLIRRLREQLTIEQTRRDVGVITVKARSTSAAEAQTLANLVARSYVNQRVSMGRREARAMKSFASTQLETQATRLKEAEQDLQVYQEREQAVALDDEARRLATNVATLQASFDEARVEREMVETELSALKKEVVQLQPGTADRIAAGTEQKISALQTAIAQKEVGVASKYARNPQLRGHEDLDPDLARERAEIEEMRKQLKVMSDQFVADVLKSGSSGAMVTGAAGQIGGLVADVVSVQREIAKKQIRASGLRAREKVLGIRIKAYEDEYGRIPEQSRKIADLERRKQRLEKTYSWLHEKYDQSRIAEASTFGNSRILDRAGLPDEPVSPHKAYSLVLGLLVALILAGLLVALREILDERIHGVEGVCFLGIPLLGVIVNERVGIRMYGQTQTTGSRKGIESTRTEMNASVSDTAQDYHRITAQLQARCSIHEPQVLVVANVNREANAAVVASSLSLSAAEAGLSTIIVDADLDRPLVHSQFEVSGHGGLSNLIIGEAYAGRSICETRMPGLSLLPAGDAPLAPATLIASEEFTRLIAHLRSSFDRIIVKAGPVCSTGSTVSIAGIADEVLMVIRSEFTTSGEATEAYSILRNAGIEYVSAVLTGVNVSHDSGTRFAMAQSLPKTHLPRNLEKNQPQKRNTEHPRFKDHKSIGIFTAWTLGDKYETGAISNEHLINALGYSGDGGPYRTNHSE